MFSTYWYSANSYGYNPFGFNNLGGRQYAFPIQTASWSSTGDCMNPNLPNYSQNPILVNKFYPDGTPYKKSAEELRNYILELEANRRIEDLANVNFSRPVKPGDVLLYNQSTGDWELTDFISGGEW